MPHTWWKMIDGNIWEWRDVVKLCFLGLRYIIHAVAEDLNHMGI